MGDQRKANDSSHLFNVAPDAVNSGAVKCLLDMIIIIIVFVVLVIKLILFVILVNNFFVLPL